MRSRSGMVVGLREAYNFQQVTGEVMSIAEALDMLEAKASGTIVKKEHIPGFTEARAALVKDVLSSFALEGDDELDTEVDDESFKKYVVTLDSYVICEDIINDLTFLKNRKVICKRLDEYPGKSKTAKKLEDIIGVTALKLLELKLIEVNAEKFSSCFNSGELNDKALVECIRKDEVSVVVKLLEDSHEVLCSLGKPSLNPMSHFGKSNASSAKKIQNIYISDRATTTACQVSGFIKVQFVFVLCSNFVMLLIR